MTMALALLIIAATCILLEAINHPTPRSVNLFYLGIFFIVVSWIVAR